MALVDPEAIHAAREELLGAIGKALEPLWRDLHLRSARGSFSLSPEDRGARKLRNVALSYLVASGAQDAAGIALTQYEAAHNMTERQGALAVLANRSSAERTRVLDDFYTRYAGDALVLDKWFQTQALAFHPDTVEIVRGLGQHKDFTLSNPNRVRSLYGAFGANQWAFSFGRRRGLHPPRRPHLHARPREPADGGADGAAARALAPLRRTARWPDARRAGAHPRAAGAYPRM
jgi:aminopeptidase N